MTVSIFHKYVTSSAPGSWIVIVWCQHLLPLWGQIMWPVPVGPGRMIERPGVVRSFCQVGFLLHVCSSNRAPRVPYSVEMYYNSFSVKVMKVSCCSYRLIVVFNFLLAVPSASSLLTVIFFRTQALLFRSYDAFGKFHPLFL